MKRCLCLLLTCLLLLLTACGTGENAVAAMEPEEPAVHYAALDTRGKAAYRVLLRGLRERKEAVALPLREETVFDTVFEAVLYDHPELMGVGHQGTLYTGPGRLRFSPQYLYGAEEAASRQQKMDQKITQITEQVLKPGMTPFEKELALHDWLVANCRYDEEALKREDPEVYTAFSAIVLGRAVCEGYAKAFALLLQKVEIPCTLVVGRARQEGKWESHMWNAVLLENQWYYADPTWNVNERSPKTAVHTYFNITEKQLRQDHEIDSGHVDALSGEQNYFVRRGLQFAQYDDDAKAAIRRALEKSKAVEVAFSGKESYRFAVKKLVDEEQIHSLYAAARPGEKIEEVIVTYNDAQFTMLFEAA